ncbi:MAG: cyclodeaminase/cyclohydrolase family protein [Synergistaceae bacterium]|nr:cyclodeaminase/cyclohydrolase family protein [Synergistaceae bacterium]
MSQLRETTLSAFIEQLAARSAYPAGGSSAALAGALGGALVSMACRLTIGKEGYEEAEEELNSVLSASETLRIDLLSAVDKDAEAYQKVLKARSLPEDTEDEQKIRAVAVRAAFREACESPRQIARDCLEVLRLCLRVSGLVNVSTICDLGAAAIHVLGGMEISVMNAQVNLPFVSNDEYSDEVWTEMEGIQEEGRILKSAVIWEILGELRAED